MNKTTGIIIGAIALLLIGGFVYISTGTAKDGMMNKDTSVSMTKEENVDMMNKDEEMDTMDTEEATDTIDKADAMAKAGLYEAYAPEKLARALDGDVVLFFHASWCPSCRGLNADIEKNLEAIPGGLSILKTDYDTETELRKKYEITYQHTLVQVDKDGNLIKKWSGSPSLDRLVAEIQ